MSIKKRLIPTMVMTTNTGTRNIPMSIAMMINIMTTITSVAINREATLLGTKEATKAITWSEDREVFVASLFLKWKVSLFDDEGGIAHFP